LQVDLRLQRGYPSSLSITDLWCLEELSECVHS
jgi:hypothetical protein